MKNILLFLTTVTGFFFFFLAPLKRYIGGQRANEIANRTREIERNLHTCEELLHENGSEARDKTAKMQSSKRYHSSVNVDFLECLHSAVYNTTTKTTATKPDGPK